MILVPIYNFHPFHFYVMIVSIYSKCNVDDNMLVVLPSETIGSTQKLFLGLYRQNMLPDLDTLDLMLFLDMFVL